MVLVVSRDDDAVSGDAGESDVIIDYSGDGRGGARDSFDAYASLGILDCRKGDDDGFNDVVEEPAHEADGETWVSCVRLLEWYYGVWRLDGLELTVMVASGTTREADVCPGVAS